MSLCHYNELSCSPVNVFKHEAVFTLMHFIFSLCCDTLFNHRCQDVKWLKCNWPKTGLHRFRNLCQRRVKSRGHCFFCFFFSVITKDNSEGHIGIQPQWWIKMLTLIWFWMFNILLINVSTAYAKSKKSKKWKTLYNSYI